MRADDLIVEVRDKTLQRVGVIPPQHLDINLALAQNAPGTWTITLPESHPMAHELMKPGAGIVVSDREGEIYSGPAEAPSETRNAENPSGLVTITGIGDSCLPFGRHAWPEPSNPDASTQTKATDTRTGLAETLMHQYVSVNIGPGAPFENAVPGLRMGVDGRRGLNTKLAARFEPLGEWITSIGSANSLGWEIVQRGDALVFETFSVTDRSKSIVLSVQDGTLASHTAALTPPTATRALVAGAGENEWRQFEMFTTPESLDSEALWGRRIDKFIDARGTSDPTAHHQAALEVLNVEGVTGVSMQAVPVEAGALRYRRDYLLGDTVSVIVLGQQVPAVITGMVLKADAEGVQTGLVLGDPVIVDKNAFIAQAAEKAQEANRRIGYLERQASGGGGTSGSTLPTYSGSLPALAADSWVTITHAMARESWVASIREVGSGEVINLDIRHVSDNAIAIRSGISYPAGALHITLIGGAV